MNTIRNPMMEIEPTGQHCHIIWPTEVAKTSLKPKNLRPQYLANQARKSHIVTVKREQVTIGCLSSAVVIGTAWLQTGPKCPSVEAYCILFDTIHLVTSPRRYSEVKFIIPCLITQLGLHNRHIRKLTQNTIKCNVKATRMWANAQRDGRSAEYRWCPLFNDAKFVWRPLLECRAVMPRGETRWN